MELGRWYAEVEVRTLRKRVRQLEAALAEARRQVASCACRGEAMRASEV